MNWDVAVESWESGDRSRMQSAARDLGRELATGKVTDYRALRRRIATVKQATRDGFAEGFLEALSMVSRGFEAESEADRDVEAVVSAVRTRRHWLDALAQIVDGCRRPKDLAKALRLDASQVTGLLDELEDAALVVRREPSAGEDQRTRPFQMTAHGHAIAALAMAGRQVAPIEPVVKAVVRCIALLLADGRASQTRLAEVFHEGLEDPPAEVAALQHLTRALADTSMALIDQDDSVVAPSIELQSQLDLIVEHAIRNADAPIVARLEQLASRRRLILRVSDRGRWSVMLRERKLKNIQVVRNEDVRRTPDQLLALPEAVERAAAGASSSPDPAYQILYESPTLLGVDQQLPENASFIKDATSRFLFGIQPIATPHDFQMIDVTDLR